jgi:aryl-alcohol dehydrogenase-like predicted oxidoreductase
MQNMYNLIQREEEREMNPYCVDAGIAGIPWSPLAMGKLLGKNRDTARAETLSHVSKMLGGDQEESNDIIVDRIEELSKKLNVTKAQVALAWIYTKDFTTSPIVGVSKTEQLYDLIGAINVKLSDEDVKYLEEPYTPRAPLPI